MFTVNSANKRFSKVNGVALLLLFCGIVMQTAWTEEASPASVQLGTRTELSQTPWNPKALESDDKVIYGTDDRIDVYQETDTNRLAWAASTCALVDSYALTDNGDGTYTVNTYAYEIYGYPPCTGEPFANQPTAAWCTGFMVNSDMIATAGHCVSESDLSSTRFVFGFDMQDATTPVVTFNADQIYKGTEIVAHKYTSTYDYTIVRVDRPITVASALPLRTEGTVAVGTPVGIIGHPSGLPKKIAFGANTLVRDNSASGYFTANMDDYAGNSGSPVFNATDGVVEGILVRGKDDFSIEGSCFRSNVFPDNTTDSEEVSKSVTFAAYVYGEGEIDDGCCGGIFSCSSGTSTQEDLFQALGDVFLIGVSLLVLIGLGFLFRS